MSASTTTTKSTFSGFYVPPILSWQNPASTGIVLAETLGLFLVFSSPLTLRYFLKYSAYLVGLLSLAEIGSRTVSGKPTGLVSSYRPSRFVPINDKFVNDVASYVAHIISRATFGIQHLLDARDPVKGLKLAAAFYTVSVFLSFLPLKSLVLTSIVLAFSLPPLYLQFKPEVDEAVEKLAAKFHEQTKVAQTKFHEKAGPHLEKVKKFLPQSGAVKASTATTVPSTSTSTTVPSTSTTAPAAAATSTSTSTFGAVPTSSTADVKTTVTSTAASVKAPADDTFKTFDSVPSLAGNIPIDHEKLAAQLAADRAKAEGAVNGL